MKRVRIGVSFEPTVANALDEQVRLSPDLSPDRSEMVNVIIKAFFRPGLDHRARVRELVIMSREGHLTLKSVNGVPTEAAQPAPLIE